VQALRRHGVLGRGDDGALRPLRPRALRSALELHRARIGTVAALQILGDVLAARIAALTPDAGRGGVRTWEELDRVAGVLSQALVGLLTEAFRVAVER